MKPRIAQVLGFALQIVGLFFLFIAFNLNRTAQVVMLIIGGVPFLTGTIVKLVFWRCPNCRKLLPMRNAFAITHCPWCMEQLDN